MNGEGGDDASLECDLTGTYFVLATAVSGNCGPLTSPAMLTVPESRSGVATETEMQFGRSLTTTVVLKGCSLRLAYDVVSSNGTLELSLSADDLQQVSEGLLQGRAFIERYAPTMPQTVACEGVYELTMSKRP
jgi:hypothetical protein